jgi:hypothetical protein
MITNRTKMSPNSNLSLNKASRSSIKLCVLLLSCVREVYHMGVFSSIIMGSNKDGR